MEGPPLHMGRCTPPLLPLPPHSPLEVGVAVGIHQTLAHPRVGVGEEYLKCFLELWPQIPLAVTAELPVGWRGEEEQGMLGSGYKKVLRLSGSEGSSVT